MRKLFLAVWILCPLLLGCPAGAQTTSVTATLTDTDGVTWVNGSCMVSLVYKQQSPIVAPYLNAGGAVPLNPNCSVNGLGQLNTGLTDVAFIAPIFEATWKFTVCPNVGPRAACGTVNIPVTGASEDVSSLLALPPPRVGGGPGATAYADVEVSAVFNNVYWNIVGTSCRQFGTAWSQCAVSGTGFPVTLGSTSLGSGSHTTAVTGLAVNGVTLDATGSSTLFLNKSGGYSSPGGASGFPITLGSTSIGTGSTTTAVAGLSVNGVTLNSGGSATSFLNAAGGYTSPAASGVPTVNTFPGPLVLSFSAGAGSCGTSGGTTTCTITGSSSGTGTLTNFIASAGGWPSWLVPTVATSTTTPALTVAASAIPNSALANSAVTIGGQSVSLGGSQSSFGGLALTTTSVNGVTPQSNGSATSFLNAAGGYTTPSGTGTQTICSGTVALGTSAIASGAAATTVTASCSGLASTDNIMVDFNGSPLGVTGWVPSANGMLTIIKWPSANTINVAVVNNTQASVTPGAITLNFRVTR